MKRQHMFLTVSSLQSLIIWTVSVNVPLQQNRSAIAFQGESVELRVRVHWRKANETYIQYHIGKGSPCADVTIRPPSPSAYTSLRLLRIYYLLWRRRGNWTRIRSSNMGSHGLLLYCLRFASLNSGIPIGALLEDGCYPKLGQFVGLPMSFDRR